MNKLVKFLNEVKIELGKATWPKYDELVGSTIVVLILVVFFATLLGAMDFGFSTFIKRLFEYR
ncbi:preprotein translocase subunit SecE [Candidatus Babeliales bacterium]|nr:preprotein translocase subunit SecE [Candidatus Babeliales bacterium]